MFALIENNTAIQVSHDPSSEFHSLVADKFSRVPANVRVGWRLDDEGAWSAPAVPDPTPEPVNTIISPTAFKRRFTLTERTAIAMARALRTSTDPTELQLALALDIFFEDLDDPRLTEMDLTDETVSQGLAFLVSVGIITQERADVIGAP